MKQAKVIISRDNQVVAELEGLRTETLRERLGGLLVIKRLQPEQLLWITPCNSIHTLGMRYSLDLVYVDRYGKVCGLRENIKPWRMSFNLKAKATLELNASMIAALNLKVGDSCEWLN